MIYFIKSGPFVKIGYSLRDPIRRLEKMQVGNPVKLSLVAVADGELADEREWHSRFRKLRVRGEWFKFEPALRSAIEPHLVDHAEWSRDRPQRTIAGTPAWQIAALLEAHSAGLVDLETARLTQEQSK